MGGFFVPTSNGGGNGVHGLDTLHKSYWDPSQEVGNQGGSILGLIVFRSDDVQFKLVDVFLELFSSGDVGGGEPVHGFLLGIDVPKAFSKSVLKVTKVPKDWLANLCYQRTSAHMAVDPFFI